MALLFFPAFLNKSPLVQTDQASWAAISHVWANEVFPSQKWFCETITDRTGAGQSLGKTYSMNLILACFLGKVFGAATAIKISMVGSALIFVLSFYFVATNYMSNKFAILSTLLILNPFLFFIISGMWYSILSVGFALIFWYFMDIFYKDRTSISVLISMLSLSLVILSHPVGVILCLGIWFSYFFLIIKQENKEKFKNLLIISLIPLVAILLSFPQVQALLGLGLESVKVPITDKYYMNDIGETLRNLFLIMYNKEANVVISNTFSGFLLLSFIIGLYVLIRKSPIWASLPVILLMVIAGILVSRIFNLLDWQFPLFKQINQFSYRFSIISQVCLFLIGGTGLNYLYRRMKNVQVLPLKVILILFISFFGIMAVMPFKQIYLDYPNYLSTFNQSIVYQDMLSLFKWLNNNVDPMNERVYLEDSYKSLKWHASDNDQARKSHIMALTAIYTNINQINGWCGYTNSFAKRHECGGGQCLFGKSFLQNDISDEFIQEELKLLNCKYIVAHSDIVFERLKSVEFLKLAVTIGSFHVFENTIIAPAWSYNVATKEKVIFKRRSPAHFEINANGQKGEIIQLSFAYRPHWKARYKNDIIPIINYLELMQIKLPVSGEQKITFTYELNKKLAYTLIYIGSLVLMFTILINMRINKEPAKCSFDSKN